jgi:hypothetical protein
MHTRALTLTSNSPASNKKRGVTSNQSMASSDESTDLNQLEEASDKLDDQQPAKRQQVRDIRNHSPEAKTEKGKEKGKGKGKGKKKKIFASSIGPKTSSCGDNSGNAKGEEGTDSFIEAVRNTTSMLYNI